MRWSEDLVCYVRGIEADFVSGVVIIRCHENSVSNMSGAVRMARAVDAECRTIVLYNETGRTWAYTFDPLFDRWISKGDIVR